MAIQYVQQKTNSGVGVTSVETVFDSDTTTGNRIITLSYVALGGTHTLTDDGSHDFTKVLSEVSNDTNGLYFSIGYSEPITGRAAHGVTFSFGLSATLRLTIAEFSGIDSGGSPVITQAWDAQNGTSASSGSINPAGSGILYVGSVYEPNGGFTRTWTSSSTLTGGAYGEGAYLISSGSQAATWTITTSGEWVAGIIALAEQTTIDLWPYAHDGVKPWSSMWRPARI